VIGALSTQDQRGNVQDPGHRHAHGGGGDMTVDNTNVQPAQLVTITSFSVTAGGA
jgi:hypothetical protein